MSNEPLDVRVPVMMSRSGVQAVDAWRRAQPELLPRAEAIRRLIELGLETSKRQEQAAIGSQVEKA